MNVKIPKFSASSQIQIAITVSFFYWSQFHGWTRQKFADHFAQRFIDFMTILTFGNEFAAALIGLCIFLGAVVADILRHSAKFHRGL